MCTKKKINKVREEQFQLVVPKHGNQLSAPTRKNLMGYFTWYQKIGTGHKILVCHAQSCASFHCTSTEII